MNCLLYCLADSIIRHSKQIPNYLMKAGCSIKTQGRKNLLHWSEGQTSPSLMFLIVFQNDSEWDKKIFPEANLRRKLASSYSSKGFNKCISRKCRTLRTRRVLAHCLAVYISNFHPWQKPSLIKRWTTCNPTHYKVQVAIAFKYLWIRLRLEGVWDKWRLNSPVSRLRPGLDQDLLKQRLNFLLIFGPKGLAPDG